MRMYMAGLEGRLVRPHYVKCKYLLSSFYYVKRKTHMGNNSDLMKFIRVKNKEDRFLLDSGAFTFLSSGSSEDIDDYVSEYIDFINREDIRRFMELDIDPIVGYEKVRKIRERINRETGKKCIPVWHKSRGIDKFKEYCEDYDYVAIGGIVTREIKPSEYKNFTSMCRYARSKGTLIHGLGYINKDAYKQGFFSVDSTSWKSGEKFASVMKFNGTNIVAGKKPENVRMRKEKAKLVNDHNFVEYLKYQEYLDTK